jgi:2-polyprenyl-3-methyl-5-hydroxy-6-metoxy-1,4-benzoquinol methylase
LDKYYSRPVNKDKLRYILRLASRNIEIPEENINALDVGSGSGKLLQLMRDEFNWQVEGIEPAPYYKLAATKHNLVIHNLPLDDYETLTRYDVISMMSVLEHTPNPIRMLERARSLINRDGILILETPNVESLSAWFYKSKWSGLIPPAHITLFSPKTMKQLIKKAGFKPAKFLINGYFPGLKRLGLADRLQIIQLKWGISLPKMDSMLIFAKPI